MSASDTIEHRVICEDSNERLRHYLIRAYISQPDVIAESYDVAALRLDLSVPI